MMNQIKVGKRLGIAFSTAVVLVINLAALSYGRMSDMHNNLLHITNIGEYEISLSHTMSDAVSQAMISIRDVIVIENEKLMQEELNKLNNDKASYKAADKQLDDLLSESNENNYDLLQLLKKTREYEISSSNIIIEILHHVEKHENALAFAKIENLRPIQQQWQETIKSLITKISNQHKDKGTVADKEYKKTLLLLLSMTLLSIILATWGGVAITKSITIPISSALSIANNVAKGDLKNIPETTRLDEAGDLFRALHHMNSNLTRIVETTRVSANTIHESSNEIARKGIALSARTESQASALEQTAAAMEELAATVHQNEQSIANVEELIIHVSKLSDRGHNSVTKTMMGINDISDSSRQIGSIISIVDSIAFQTNILALNAAVEAAHAGEHGRGFAVVAREIRSLAHRSADAAKEIKNLIDDSASQVIRAHEHAIETGTTIKEVVHRVNQVAEIMTGISRASVEQRIGIDQVTEAIMLMDNQTQENATSVQLAANDSANLMEQSIALSAAVGFFKIQKNIL